ncbi:Crp/Fnr family transcriptional regulator [Jiella sonneratiae]|uniref:Crp/Fnr family transcriptional regulator n=1 Tax=Jiella sonneratiae TaxID=2816856 RepID=A0ABS3J7F5_9HYPH|nr:Crp/Fnr family transcriptional regulator [Jiella sonneratiae]MBO0905614.1 Crp/Fnr family transcriptional regulator [Jiella sonneratiae]
MFNPLIRKLSIASDFTESDNRALNDVIVEPHSVAPKQDIIRTGDRPENVHLVMDGIACRYKIMPNGDRQIVAFLLPGDFCDLHVAILGEMDHGIATLSPCKMIEIPRTTINDLTENYPRITRALWWATLVDEAILREWIAGIGQRMADKRIAHLFCELYLRLKTVGQTEDHSFTLPITQQELADALGISIVHANRMLMDLRTRNIMVMRGKHVKILNYDALKAFAEFSPDYLHLERRSENGNGQRSVSDKGR